MYVIHLFRKYFRHERMMKKLLESENRNISLAADSYQAREVLNTCTLIYQACDQLNDKNISSEGHAEKIGQIRESVMSLSLIHICLLFLPVVSGHLSHGHALV